ncbi:phasin family protein [Beggiatoa leptomitoformis]|nr:phasin family protein [Beggiatoa leptomitoformis]
MQTQFKNWSELNKNAFASAQQFADLQNAFLKNLTQKQLDMVGLYMESGVKQLRAFSEVKDFSNVFTAQLGVLKEVNQSLLGHYQSILKMIVDLQSDFSQLAEQNYKQSSALAEEKIKEVLVVADEIAAQTTETVQQAAAVMTETIQATPVIEPVSVVLEEPIAVVEDIIAPAEEVLAAVTTVEATTPPKKISNAAKSPARKRPAPSKQLKY